MAPVIYIPPTEFRPPAGSPNRVALSDVAHHYSEVYAPVMSWRGVSGAGAGLVAV